jgi:hypothetical protein
MSREVLLNVSSSAIELAEASTTQIRPIATDGPAARSADRQLSVSSAGDDPGGGPARRSSAVEAVCRAMIVVRRRRIVREARRWRASAAPLSVEGYGLGARRVK